MPEASKIDTEKDPVCAFEMGLLIADMARGLILAKTELTVMMTEIVGVLKVEFLRAHGKITELILHCMALKSAKVKSDGKST